jgi:hypothetical protein
MSLRLVIIKEAVESWVGVCQRISVPLHTWGSEEDQPVLSPGNRHWRELIGRRQD